MRTCNVLVGEGRGICRATYDIDYEGVMSIEEVEFENVGVMPLMCEDYISDIEMQCWKDAEAEAKNDEYDRGEEAARNRQEWRYEIMRGTV